MHTLVEANANANENWQLLKNPRSNIYKDIMSSIKSQKGEEYFKQTNVF